MEKTSNTDFFSYTEFVQKICGFGITCDGTFKVQSRVRLFLFVLYPFVVFFPTELIMTVYNAKNLSNAIGTLVNTLTHAGIIFKMATYYMNRLEIACAINILKTQNYELTNAKIVFSKYQLLSEKWAKVFVITGSLICFFMAASAIYIIVFNYELIIENDITLFPNFGRDKFGFILFWLHAMFSLSTFLWVTVGKC